MASRVKHVLSADQFSENQLIELFELADLSRQTLEESKGRLALANKYIGKQLCSLFYEPSTRTRISFEKAALNLGLGVVSTENAKEFSSAAKGETIEDTVKVLDQYGFDAIVIRHHQEGSLKRAAEICQTPIINAGDGTGEHPTQALLDSYTIFRQFQRLDNLNIILGGDLANGRTARSLVKLLSRFSNNKFFFVSPASLAIKQDIKDLLPKNSFEESTNLQSYLMEADVVYWTRVQKERLTEQSFSLSDDYILTPKIIEQLKQTAIIMHPLPRVNEIEPSVDQDPRAKYFEQAGNGLYIRMALLDLILQEH